MRRVILRILAGQPGLLAFWVLAGCGPGGEGPCTAAELGAAPEEAAFAVVASDYLSTAVALLDAQGRLLEEAWVDSGTVAPGLAMALSGDVVLPTEPPPAGRLVLLDRFGTDVVDHFDLSTGRVLGQWPASVAPAGGAAWRPNPYDVVRLPGPGGGVRWVVSRFEPNLDPDAPQIDRGDDLLVLDEAGRAVERWPLADARLDLADGTRIQARPSRMVRRGAGDRWLVVGLARLSADFRRTGPGAVAVLDADTRRLARVCELPGLSNCGEVAAEPGDPLVFYVACRGAAFVGYEARLAEAGVVRVRLDPATGGCEELAPRWPAEEGIGAPSAGLVPLGDGTLLAVAEGETAAGVPDRLLWLRADGTLVVVHEARAAFVLGQGAASGDGRLALVPSAEGGVLRLGRDRPAEPPRSVGWSVRETCRGLPPRQVGRLAARPDR